MFATRKITEDIVWVGGNDRRLALFENLFPIPRGVSYNSYLVKDEKTLLLDTGDGAIQSQFLENLTHELGGRSLDYLIINHMEPDHCALIEELLLRYPKLEMIGNSKTFTMLDQFFGFDTENKRREISEGDSFSTGKHTFRFYMAPMVHWPEAMVTFEEENGILFSADAFGCFGTLDGSIFQDEVNFERDWLDDARRYYSNIVGKYGASVQALMKKAANLPIKMICPLHGLVWRSQISYLLEKYEKWSTYQPESDDVLILYGSMYGNTASAVESLACKIREAGKMGVKLIDISKADLSEQISEIFRCGTLVFAAPTYNGGIYPKMEQLLTDMKALNVQNRRVAIIENGTWAPASKRLIQDKLTEMKQMSILEESVTIKSSLRGDACLQMEKLAQAITR